MKARTWIRSVLLLLACYVSLGMSGCMNISTPTDYLLNLGPIPELPECRVSGGREVVVLKHGLFRSAGAMWRLERALRAHGYEVLNQSYPSTQRTIEEHADAMAKEIRAWQQANPGPARFHFIGHSLGGLLIRQYLSRADHVPAATCIYLATPQRGAVLADRRRDWLLFRLLAGSKASLQLSPSAPFFQNLRPHDPTTAVGVLFGCSGRPDGWNRDVPGDDDGTIAVSEAHLPGATDSLGLPYGHTRLGFTSAMIEAVLRFLGQRHFRRGT